ncbi:hypothetical protein [Variovorax sp.]|uniref:hypothetical protein n=1 Tax=Variovorax sp. TaxID=1871043 RepID=UPI0037DA17D6
MQPPAAFGNGCNRSPCMMSNYSHLWDGTEPSWVLLQVHRQTSTLAVLFEEPGASLLEIQTLRRVVPEFAALSAQQAVLQLRGRWRIDLGEMEFREARRLIERLRDCRLRVEKQTLDRGGYLPFNEVSKMALLIENEVESRAVAAEALRQGIPVRQVES